MLLTHFKVMLYWQSDQPIPATTFWPQKPSLGHVSPIQGHLQFNNGANLLQKTLDKGLMVKVFMTVLFPAVQRDGLGWVNIPSFLSLPSSWSTHLNKAAWSLIVTVPERDH